MRILSGISLIIILVVAPKLQAADNYCGELSPPEQNGPYDYTNPINRQNGNLSIVESNHFDRDVKNLVKGITGDLGGDIDYTLRSFPNHHPALQSMARLSLRDKEAKPEGSTYSVECWFERGIRFKPGDGMVRMIYAIYLLKLGGRHADALEQYEVAISLEPGNANINYNLGLLYLKEKNYEQATVYAKKAYELGFPLPGLRNRLMKMGKWDGKLDEDVGDEVAENVNEEIDIESQK